MFPYNECAEIKKMLVEINNKEETHDSIKYKQYLQKKYDIKCGFYSMFHLFF